jgi:serine protease Do
MIAMNRRTIWIALLVLAGFLLGGLAYYLIDTTGLSGGRTIVPNVPAHVEETGRAFADIAKAVSPAVVNISSTKIVRQQSAGESMNYLPGIPNGKAQKFREQSLGSGVIVSSDGYIVTNSHVIEQSNDIRVSLYDRRSFKARVIGIDSKTDIAIIKIDATDLPVIAWGDSEKLQVGEFVLAIGNPFLLSHTVTMGIVSAVGRADVGISAYENFIQTDAAINPGNSGGPLVNIRGELVGINSAIFSKTGGYQGIGFAAPSNMVKLVMDQLIKVGKVTRGWIGVTIQELTPELSQQLGAEHYQGVLVSDVARNSPAQLAGITRGDIILEYDGKKTIDVGTMRNAVAQSRVSSQSQVRLIRRDKEMTLSVTVAELPVEGGDAKAGLTQRSDSLDNVLTGMRVTDLNSVIAKQLGIEPDEKGVVVMNIDSGAPADDAGLRRGDVISEINRSRISNLNDFNRIIARIKPGDSALLFVNRSGRKFYTTLEP